MDEATEPFCYLRTVGRVSGQPHEIEIWFAAAGDTLYLLSGGGDRSDWVRNLVANPSVEARVGEVTRPAQARVLERGTDEDRRARDLVFGKYQGGYGGDLTRWREAALAVAVDRQS